MLPPLATLMSGGLVGGELGYNRSGIYRPHLRLYTDMRQLWPWPPVVGPLREMGQTSGEKPLSYRDKYATITRPRLAHLPCGRDKTARHYPTTSMESATTRTQTEKQKKEFLLKQIAILQGELSKFPDAPQEAPSSPKRKSPEPTLLAPPTPSPSTLI